MLETLLLLTALSTILAILFTPIVRTLALRCNLVDLPDNKRKVHKRPIPRVGGVALAAAYALSLLATAAWVSYRQPAASMNFAAVKSIALPSLIIFLIGLADDIFNLKPMHKFGMQLVAAVMVVCAGVQIHGVGAYSVHPGVGKVVTVIWLVACTNAINLIDGLDGLAAGIALLATVTISVASLISGNIGLAVATAPLAGALLGFLVFNFNPASIFLGDSGSLLLGFLLGCNSIMWSGTSETVLQMAAPLMALAVPLIDTTLAIGRRFLREEPIFKADRSHIHHRLLARGLSHRGAVLLLYVAASIAGSLSLCLISARDLWEGVVIAAFTCAAILSIQKLGYREFDALRRVVLAGGIRREIRARLALEAMQESLAASQTADETWGAIQHGCAAVGFQAIGMQLAGRHFRSNERTQETWVVRIPITEHDWINLSRTSSSAVDYPTVVAPLANTIRRVLRDKKFTGVAVEEQSGFFSAAPYTTAA